VEPIQGEGGLRPADGAYLKTLRELCDRTGALLIFDEVQCGMGRTGDLFAYMGYGVTPDILTVAKALGNGYPVGAMLTTDAIGRHFTVGSHGTTYGGNPLAAAVAAKVVETIARPAFLAQVREAAGYLAGKLDALAREFPDVVAEVRGRGLMTGLALTKAHQGRAKDIARAAEACGLMVLIAGPDVVRLLPALVVTRAQIDEADALLRQALQAYLAQS
jgi:acetylornithine/succinyldiaminopimelate/putrescine aminotransferase